MTAAQNARPCLAMRGNSASGTSLPRATPCRSEYRTRTDVTRGSSMTAAVATCTSGCAMGLSPRGPGPCEEPVEQRAGVARRLVRSVAMLLEQRAAVGDAEVGEPARVGLGPPRDDLDRALGMEL